MTSAWLKPGPIPSSEPIWPSAGVTMVDEKGEMKVKHETRIVAVHFLAHGQLNGFSGSSGPSQEMVSVDACTAASGAEDDAAGHFSTELESEDDGDAGMAETCVWISTPCADDFRSGQRTYFIDPGLPSPPGSSYTRFPACFYSRVEDAGTREPCRSHGNKCDLNSGARPQENLWPRNDFPGHRVASCLQERRGEWKRFQR